LTGTDGTVAKTTPIEFINQVKAETRKVTWPTWKETWMTGLMVVIMTTILAIFFLGVDSFFNALVNALLKLAQ
jgi:preprotein translocase subunit SecE